MRRYEFWHPRIFEAPYYLYLLGLCATHRLPVRDLAKANYALDHGELGLGSKYSTQMAFDQTHFLPTIHLEPQHRSNSASSTLAQSARAFGRAQGYPVILKPDIGAVGKGILKLADESQLDAQLAGLRGPYLLQSFTPFASEYGVFYSRRQGRPTITGINKKHFPTVIGNGSDNILQLARAHPRYTDHWRIFLQYTDTRRVPISGEVVRLSFIGSHTMGCKFTDDTDLLTPAIEQTINEICDDQPGFNFGRLDVKAESEEEFQAGRFVVIEVNGVASLPTQMFDPTNSIWRAYRIFLRHAEILVQTAMEHRHRDMPLDGYRTIWRRAKSNHQLLNLIHEEARTAF